MNPMPAELFDLAASRLRDGVGDAGDPLRRAVAAVTAAPPLSALGHLAVETGWLASRVAGQHGFASPGLETAAAMLSCLSGDPRRAAALTTALERWPSGLVRLVAASRERQDGSGPLGRFGRTLPGPARRVALALATAPVVRRQEGQAEAVLAVLARQCEAGRWLRRDLDAFAPAVAGLCGAVLQSRRESLAGRAFRVSAAHEGVAEPKTAPAVVMPAPAASGRHAYRGVPAPKFRTASGPLGGHRVTAGSGSR